MANEFIHWDHLDLDEVLGDNNWTDNEEVELWGRESEWDSGSENDVTLTVTDKENRLKSTTTTTTAASTSTSVPTNTKKHFQCPLCDKQYATSSGFRGHVMKKHNRQDLKAHMNQIKVAEISGLPESEVPLTTPASIDEEIKNICQASLEGIRDDKMHSLPSSKCGSQLVTIAINLLAVNLSTLHLLLLTYLSPIFSSELHEDAVVLGKVGQLRTNTDFIDSMANLIKDCVPLVQIKFIKLFIQRLVTNLVMEYFKLQKNLLTIKENSAASDLSENDRQVICYICGYIIHALKKRYYRHSSNKWTQLLMLTDKLQAEDEAAASLPVQWTNILDRGGLKRPCRKFLSLILQVERWVREVAQINKLHSDSLVSLKAKLLDYNLLKLSWDKIITCDNDKKWLILEHVLSLFLKVRGFAITKHVRKQLQKKRKNTRVAAGSQKALRKQLKQLST